MIVFVDSGGWLACAIASDQYHAAAAPYFRTLLDKNARLVTSDFVIDEVVTRIRYDIGHQPAVQFLDLARSAALSGAVRVVRVADDVWDDAEAIFKKYRDSRLSFTDCTSFAWLAKHAVDEVFGFDHHFEMMGHMLRPKS